MTHMAVEMMGGGGGGAALIRAVLNPDYELWG